MAARIDITNGDLRDQIVRLENQIEGAKDERAKQLTHQLLAFSRKQVLAPKVLDLAAILSDLGRMLPRLLEENVRVTVATDAPAGSSARDTDSPPPEHVEAHSASTRSSFTRFRRTAPTSSACSRSRPSRTPASASPAPTW